MTKWTKIEKGHILPGSHPRKVPAISSAGAYKTRLVLPHGFTDQRAVNYYLHGNKLGIELTDNGDYTLRRNGTGGLSQRATIPASISRIFPLGTTDITLDKDGDMHVLDLARFERVAA